MGMMNIDKLAKSNIAKHIEDEEDKNGDIWRIVKMKKSGAIIKEKIYDKEADDKQKENEKQKEDSIKEAKLVNQKDMKVIENSNFSEDVKELLMRKLNIHSNEVKK